MPRKRGPIEWHLMPIDVLGGFAKVTGFSLLLHPGWVYISPCRNRYIESFNPLGGLRVKGFILLNISPFTLYPCLPYTFVVKVYVKTQIFAWISSLDFVQSSHWFNFVVGTTWDDAWDLTPVIRMPGPLSRLSSLKTADFSSKQNFHLLGTC